MIDNKVKTIIDFKTIENQINFYKKEKDFNKLFWLHCEMWDNIIKKSQYW